MMKDETILKKAIEKAVKNGYKGSLITRLDSGRIVTHCSYPEIIFSRGFAEAFWGEEEEFTAIYESEFENLHPIRSISLTEWQYHLQQMVIEKEPLKYLAKFL